MKKFIYEGSRKPYPAEDLNIIVTNHDQKSGILGAAYYIDGIKNAININAINLNSFFVFFSLLLNLSII